MTLSIIIVNYNVRFYVEQCLNSILGSKGIDMNEVETVVIDNCSQDNSVAYLQKIFPEEKYQNIHIIANKRNIGFGKANNQAFHKTTGKYILFLNPDTLLSEYALANALHIAEDRDHMGAVGTKMLHTNGSFALESRRGIPSPWVSLCKMTGLTALFPKSRWLGKYYMQYFSKEEINEIDVVSGAFMLVPRASLDKAGLFDEDFFMYGEDIDLSFRLKKHGFHNYYSPTPILHYKGESTKKNTYRYVHVFYEAMLIFFHKHYKHYNFIISIPINIAIVLRALLALILQQLRSLKRFLRPISLNDKQHMLYIGRSVNMIKEIAEEYGLNVDYYDLNKEKAITDHNALKLNKNYVHIVYDLNDFSIEDILRGFEHQTNRKVHIGTFNAKNGILITGSRIYTKDFIK